jgi:TetR/AcrR family transcriptional regulator
MEDQESSSPRGEETRRRILTGAAEVFAERGFAGAGVDEIARRAGVNKAMLYYHVGDKAELYSAVLLWLVAEVRARLEEAMGVAGTPEERVEATVRAFVCAAAEVPYYPQLLLRELAAGGSNLPPEVLREMAGVLGVTRTTVAEGRRLGCLRDVNPLLTHLLIVGTVAVMSAGRRLGSRMTEEGLVAPEEVPSDPDRLAAFVADVLLHGIAAPQGGRS